MAYAALAIFMPAPDTALPASSSDQQPRDPTEGPEIIRRPNLVAWSLIVLGGLIVAVKFNVFSWTSWGLLAAVLIAAGLVLLSQRSRVS